MSHHPLEIDLIVATDQRRHVTVNDHKLFLDGLLTPADLDEIDEIVEELRAQEFERKASRP